MMSMPLRKLNLALPMAVVALAALPMAGCYWPGYYPGGPRASRDLHTFESRTNFLQSIQLIDLATDTVIWSVDVPLGQQVVVRFYDDHDPENIERPALMRWEMMDRGTRLGELDNAMPAPTYDRRRLDVFLREGDPAPGLEVGTAR